MPAPLVLTLGVNSAAAIGAFTALGNVAANVIMRISGSVVRLGETITRTVRQGITQSIALGDELLLASRRLDIRPSQLAGLRLAFETTGGSFSDLTSALRGWAERGRGDFIEAVLQTAEALERVGDVTERARILNERFGRSGINLLNFMSLGRSQIELFMTAGQRVLGITDDFAARSNTLNDTWTIFTSRVRGLWVILTEKLLPALQRVLDRLVDLAFSPAMSRAIESVANVLVRLLDGIEKKLEPLLDSVPGRIEKIVNTLQNMVATFEQLGKPSTAHPFLSFLPTALEMQENLRLRGGGKAGEITPKAELPKPTAAREPTPPTFWRQLLQSIQNIGKISLPPVLGRQLTLKAAELEERRSAEFTRRGFLTAAEARAVSFQIGLQREQTSLLREIARSVRDLVPTLKEAL